MPPNFDRIARPYRLLEYLTLGSALQRCRVHFLPRVLGRKHSLVLGDGDGRFLAALLAANPDMQADAVDSSAAMLALARQNTPHADRLTTHHQSALTYMPHAETDLIAAHFFFDCLTQPELNTLIAGFASYTGPDTLWLISDFRIPDGPLRILAKLYIRALYIAFRLLTGLRTTRLPNYEAPLEQAGLIRIAQRLSLCGLLTTELWKKA